MFIFVYFRKNL